MLVVPMKTPKGEVLGVLQLMNRKPDRGRRFASLDDIAGGTVPFSARSQDLALALAAQGAVALENSKLYAELRAALVTVEESQQRIIRSERLRALGEMAGGVAHDFNNVLAVVVGRAQLLQRQIEAPELRRQLKIIEHVAQDGAQTVRRIQEFARMRRTRPWQHVDVTEVVREVVEATRPHWSDLAQARAVTYAMRLDLAPVPPVAGDPAELRETFLNLLFNALDAMPQGGSLTFSTRVEGDRVVCVVQDTGVGMSEAVRQRCFEPFFTTKAEHGTGLGLSIAYGIVTRHGGEIEVWSRPGEGSRFTVRLPVGAEIPLPPPEPPAPRAGRSARILVVGGRVRGAGGAGRCPRGPGARGRGLRGRHGGAGPFDGTPFDLALVDLSMPGLSGWEVAKSLRAAQPDVPIALVTGWGDQIDFAEARGARDRLPDGQALQRGRHDETGGRSSRPRAERRRATGERSVTMARTRVAGVLAALVLGWTGVAGRSGNRVAPRQRGDPGRVGRAGEHVPCLHHLRSGRHQRISVDRLCVKGIAHKVEEQCAQGTDSVELVERTTGLPGVGSLCVEAVASAESKVGPLSATARACP